MASVMSSATLPNYAAFSLSSPSCPGLIADGKPASAHMTRSANSPGSALPADPTLCMCGAERVFCKDPVCMQLYCEPCADTASTEFHSCEYGPKHSCYAQAQGPYCSKHFSAYLAECAECGLVACDLCKCQDCEADLCLQHLNLDSQCEECAYEARAFMLSHGVEPNEYGCCDDCY